MSGVWFLAVPSGFRYFGVMPTLVRCKRIDMGSESCIINKDLVLRLAMPFFASGKWLR